MRMNDDTELESPELGAFSYLKWRELILRFDPSPKDKTLLMILKTNPSKLE